MANYLITDTNYVQDGLGTLTYNIPSTAIYSVRLQATFQPNSSLAIVVKQNGTTRYTAPAVTPTQTALQFKFTFPFTAADVVTVVLSSAAAVDNTLNGIQANVSIGQGE